MLPVHLSAMANLLSARHVLREVAPRGTNPAMRRVLSLVIACLAITACPKRKHPERGYELVFKKEGNVRPVIEKRLALLGVVARITDDEHSLTVRIPDVDARADPSVVRQLLTLPAKLEFCPEAVPVAGTFCAVDAGVQVLAEDDERRDCALQSPDASLLLALTQDAGVAGRVLLGGVVPDGPQRTFVAEPECLAPRLMEAEVKPDPTTGRKQLAVLFDAPSATKFGELTGKLVRRRLLIVLDGRVQSAPMVMEAITGGRAMISFGRTSSDEEITRLSLALAGGALPSPMTLEKEGWYGPPSLLK